jgi:hypothetical protein
MPACAGLNESAAAGQQEALRRRIGALPAAVPLAAGE